MARRRQRSKTALSADPRIDRALRRARLLLTCETYADALALPLLVLGLFVAFAWLGVFTALATWAHLALLAIFVGWFFVALREARPGLHPPSRAMIRRRLEAVNRLRHRPLDVLDDRPATVDSAAVDPAQAVLWQAHVSRNKAQVRHLRLPRWRLSFAARDPYALRYALAILLALGGMFSWGHWGDRFVAALTPPPASALARGALTLSAWITPPDYTGLPPLMIATPAGLRHADDVVEVPEGSVLSLHLADKGEAPTLELDGQKTLLEAGAHGDFTATLTLAVGKNLALKRGWQTVARWTLRVIPDMAPQIAFAAPPTPTERKTTRIAYSASDDYGVQQVNAILSPTMSVPGLPDAPVAIDLAATPGKDIKQVDFEDLTESPWAGMPVEMQLTTRDAVGHTAQSDKMQFTLPERDFLHPVARALIEERRKLLHTADEPTRDEAANIMAGVARQPQSYRGDPLVLMALRSGAVRLVLDHTDAALQDVSHLIWQAALRIEDGTMGEAQEQLRQAQRNLAAALARNASEAEIQPLIDRLQAALDQYMRELSQRVAPLSAAAARELGALQGQRANVLTPQDFRNMLQQMRDLSASGARDAARQQLAKVQQMLENLRTAPPELTAEQLQMLQQMAALRALAREQQQVLDDTFKASMGGAQKLSPEDEPKLAERQKDLAQRLRALLPNLGEFPGEAQDKLAVAQKMMQGAGAALRKGSPSGAMKLQNEAEAALQQGLQSMMDAMNDKMLALPGPLGGQAGLERDPFGRAAAGMVGDDGSIKVPNAMELQRAREILDELQRRANESNRPKTERDYIERLLQRF